MNSINDLLKKNKDINNLIDMMKGSEYSLFCYGMTDNFSLLLSDLLYKELDKTILMVCPNAYLANSFYAPLCNVIGYESLNLYVVDDLASSEAVVISNELLQERMVTLRNIYEGKKTIIITHIEACLRPIVSIDRFRNNVINIKKNKTIDLNKFINLLVKNGYERVHTTYHLGEFSVRGEVIDIFPSCYQEPVRINFDFDSVESIRTFDLETQLTNGKVDEINIYPMNEFIFENRISEFEEKILNIESTHFIENELHDIKYNKAYGKLNKFINYIDNNHVMLFDYLSEFSDNFSVIYNSYNDIKNAYEICVKEGFEVLNKILPNSKFDLFHIYNIDDFISRVKRCIYINKSKKGMSNLTLYKIFDFNCFVTVDYENNIPFLINDLNDNNYKTFIVFKDETRLNLFKEILNQNNVNYSILNSFDSKTSKINLIVCNDCLGYGIYNEYRVITEDEIYKNIKKRKIHYRSVQETSLTISSKDDLHIGDYVVHFDYGISKYLGIKSVTLDGITNDYLELQYENMNLLIPMDKITDLEHYVGAEGVVPKLTKIGTNEWEKKKNVVKEQLEVIAKDLIDLQVKRNNLSGHKYQKDSEMQKMFEDDFIYDETLDQKRIVKEIKNDMEKGVLFDRLVCGDVGFGKTEIAMRAAFKTVYEGKQVAFMAPTTILTRQHYNSFIDRFSKYGIKIALLNRLIPENEQKKIIRELKDGSIDIVIGTHRLLNEEIGYKDLGLLIVDEEQRFGVVHKEKIKRIKNNINVLTLTATPIPRTLQMAVTGIRSLSLLETPPKDRYPIQTYVLEKNDSIIKEAIYRELSRGGQVFYLHNRVSDIVNVSKKIKKLVPEANVCIGHGKMTKEELEDVFTRYIDGEYNVLVCTTIIETGVDIPNSNTLIVDDAYRLGLAQMYQIRGRVGRTDRVAYAYFMYEENKTLTSNSIKRLDAIKEYSSVGSGYKIAVRDLAIRGAGDILGKEQSGFINSIGMDMYMKLLNQAINKAKGIKEEKPVTYRVNVSKHVDKEYVSDDTIIIYIHKQINNIKTKEDKINIINELQDRFGKLSDNIYNYIEERYLEAILRSKNIERINEAPNLVTIILPRDLSNNLNGEKVLMIGYKLSDRFSFEYKMGQFVVKITKDTNDFSWLYLLTVYFEKIFNI